MVGSIISPLVKAFTGSGSNGQPSGAANYVAGQATYNPPVSQTNAGAFTPPSGTGIAYNYIPTGAQTIDPALQAQLQQMFGAAGNWNAQTANQLGAVNQTAPDAMAGAQNAGNWLTQQGGAQATDAGNLQAANFSQLPWTAALQALGSGQQGVGAGLQAQGTNFNNSVLAQLPQFQQILQQGMDPQQALYDRTSQQVSEQQNAQLAKMGLGNSGAGAGIAQQGINNFNIDWQNNQLSRMAQALQGYTGAMSGAAQQIGPYGGGGLTNVGTNLQNAGSQNIAQGQNMLGNSITQAGNLFNQGAQGAQNIYTGGTLPFQTAVQTSAVPASIYQSYLSGTDPTTARALQYLQSITNSSQVANQAAGAQVGNNATQNANAASALSPLIQGGFNSLGSLLNNLTGSGTGANSNLSPSDLAFLVGQGGY